jgi:hypothetical protein
LLPQLPLIYGFIGTGTQDQTFALLVLSLHVMEKILLEALLRTGVILQFINQMTVMLLVHSAQVLLLIDRGCTGEF